MTSLDTCRNHLPGSMLIFLLAAVIFVVHGVSASPALVTEKTLCAALPVAGDLFPGLYWETDGPSCSFNRDYGSATILYHGYDTAEKKTGTGMVMVHVTWYPEEVYNSQEFMTNPSIYRESIRSYWEKFGSPEDIGELEGGILLSFSEPARGSEYQAFFLRSAGLYGDVKVRLDGSSEKPGLDPEEFARSEAIRLAELVYIRLLESGSPETSSPSAFRCPVGGQVPLAIDPNIPSRGLCRGACGSDCPPSCGKLPDITLSFPSGEDEYYTCTYRNVTSCGGHAGCRDHDACYDRCVAERGETNLFGPCHQSCNTNCTDTYGFCTCLGWVAGLPPYDQNLTYSDPPVATGPFTGPVPDGETPATTDAIHGKTLDEVPAGRPEEGISLGAALDKL